MTLDYISDTITREKFFEKVYNKTKSIRALETTRTNIRHFDFYCKDVYSKETDVILNDLKEDMQQTQSSSKVLNFLDGWASWARKEHPNCTYKFGRKFANERAIGPLHDNLLKTYFSAIKKYVHQVGGIRLYEQDIKMTLDLPEAHSSFQSEDIEPLTDEQARLIIENTNSQQAITIYHFMNDTAFREAETIALQEKNINWEKKPVEVYLQKEKSKAKKTMGWRYLRPETAKRLKLLCNGDPEHYPFKDYDTQSITNKSHNLLSMFRRASIPLGFTKKTYTGRYQINIHSWRKRCGTEYAKANNEAMAHGYLRHKKYLSQYIIYSEEERRQAFIKAMPFLAIDGVDKKTHMLDEERKKSLQKDKLILDAQQATTHQIREEVRKQNSNDNTNMILMIEAIKGAIPKNKENEKILSLINTFQKKSKSQ